MQKEYYMSLTNEDKYKKSFVDSFEIEEDLLNQKLEYNSIPEWDSIGHMTLIAALEEIFDISMETDDIIEFSSYEKGKEILNKYSIVI